MSTVLLTLGLAFAVLIGAFALLAISWLITGKSRLIPGACGRAPHKKQSKEDCGTKNSCSICKTEDV